MQIDMQSPFYKLCLKFVCLMLFLAYVALATRDYVAFRLAFSKQPQALRETISLEPSNAQYPHLVGWYFMFSEHRPKLAIPYLKAAVALNPHVGWYWLDLASAYQSIGAIEEQRLALEHAIDVDPTTPLVSWEVANSFLVQGDFPRAFRQFRLLLQTGTSRTRSI